MAKKTSTFWLLFLLLNVSAPGQANPNISAVVSDPEHEHFFYTVDQFGGPAKWQHQDSQALWTGTLPALSAAEGGFSADVSGKYQLLAYCSRRPIMGMIYLRIVHLQTGVLYKEITLNSNAHSELLASCNHLKFVDDDASLTFNDVNKTHKFSLRLRKITHSYLGSERHQATSVSVNQNIIIGLSDKIITWNARSEEQTRRQSIVLPGYSEWGQWDVDAKISPDRKMGFIIASDEFNRSALVWVQLSSGHIKRIFPIAESAALTNIRFINDSCVVAIVNNNSYVWSYHNPEPSIKPLHGFDSQQQRWDGHEDVAINQTWDDDNIPTDIPVPPYPPEYTNVMSPDAFPMAINHTGAYALIYDCCRPDAAGLSWIPLH